jgi:hypothetical protein
MNRYLALVLITLLAVVPRVCAGIHGKVFEDLNANGVLDPDEPGVSGVGVSDGANVVLTSDLGAFTLETNQSSSAVSVIKPAGYALRTDARQLPQYFHWLPAEAGSSQDAEYNFPLRRAEESNTFRILAFTDTQPDSPEDVGYLSRTITEPLAGARDVAFGVTLGDVVNDRAELYESVAASVAKIGIPWFNVKGNHDLALQTPADGRGLFENFFGPSTYAFHYGDTLFIAIDNIRGTGGPRYTGGLTERQFTFLANLLRLTPAEKRVVLMTHIPWFLPGPASSATFRKEDRARLFSMLQDRSRVMLLSGHTHYQRHVFHGPEDDWHGASPLHEYNVAAACGCFWGGPRDNAGIPIATMWDGTPHGYAFVSFAPERVKTDYRAARFPAAHQIGLHAPVAVRAGLGFVSYYANVFNGHERWKVESRIDDRPFGTMRQVLEWDPSYAEAYLAQDRDPDPPAGKRLPDPAVCYHLWRASLPSDLPPGEHRIQVRATSPDGDEFSAERKFQVMPK